MRWSRISYPQKIYMAQSLLSGLKTYQDRLARRGVDKALLEKIEELIKSTQEIKRQQEHLKAELRFKTSELQRVLKELGKEVSKGKTLVKLEMEQPLWRAFGITTNK